jgi:hypothetical protein
VDFQSIQTIHSHFVWMFAPKFGKFLGCYNGTDTNHLLVSSTVSLSSWHPLVNLSLTKSCICFDGMTNDVSPKSCITKVNKTIWFMYIVNLRFFLVKQAPKDPENSCWPTHNSTAYLLHHMVLTQISYSYFIHGPSIILTSIGQPKFDHILHLSWWHDK